MNVWFLRDPSRLTLERDAVQGILTTTDWLRAAAWSLGEDGCIGIDAVIRAHDHDYPVRLSYPSLFPFVPAVVTPADLSARWSGHQYLDGTLCLEWGPDTWHPSVTGAQVLESTYMLLQLENPLGSQNSPQQVAPSRHALSSGQSLRNRYLRAYLSAELVESLSRLPDTIVVPAEFIIHRQRESALILVCKISPLDGVSIEAPALPIGFREALDIKGFACKTNVPAEVLSGIATVEALEQLLGQAGLIEQSLQDVVATLSGHDRDRAACILVTDVVGASQIFVILNWSGGQVTRAEIVAPEPLSNERHSDQIKALRNKSVAVIGAGSLGSKVVVSLARMGIARLYLLDEDIFKPENGCRHVLDWRNVGEHKVYGLANLVQCIDPGIEVEVSTLNLTGQESAAALRTTLAQMNRYDLIIDATADPGVFNLATAAANTYAKPLLWAEVFAGGMGGLIARSRPELDPQPHTMRAAFYEFTINHPFEGSPPTNNYATETQSGQVLVASDADVTVIASHLARLAADTLVDTRPATYPYSMYITGLAKGWIFDAPFHTIPIATDHLPRASSDPSESNALAENIDFLMGLLRGDNEDDAAGSAA